VRLVDGNTGCKIQLINVYKNQHATVKHPVLKRFNQSKLP